MTKKITKKCENCGIQFLTYRQDAKCCSNKCSSLKRVGVDKKKIIEKKCPFCGDIFKTKRYSQIYCSNECSVKSQSTELNPLRRRVKVNCVICDKQFERMKHQKTKCCSKECGYEYQRKNIKPLLDEEKKKIDCVCDFCGKNYRVWNYRGKSKFCSRECKNKSTKITDKCFECNKEYTITKWKNNGFCSNECLKKTINKKRSYFEKITFDFIRDNFKECEVLSNKCLIYEDRKIFPDIMIDNKIIVECYGDYWHCNPEFYKGGYFHVKVRKTAEKIWFEDNNRVSFLEKNGYIVIRVWENKIRDKKDFSYLDGLKNEIKMKLYGI
jgi:hypothetical protein